MNLLDLPGVSDPTVDGIPFAMICAIEGTMTGDGRMFTAGSLTWRDLPLTLKVQHDSDGVTAVAGRIDQMYRVENTPRPGINLIVAKGVFDTGQMGSEAARLVAGQYLRGNSLEACDINLLSADEETGNVTFDAGTIMAVALTPTPAFAECIIRTLDPTHGMAPTQTAEPTVPLAASGATPVRVWGTSLRTSDEGTIVTGSQGFSEGALLASAAPLKPPSIWFHRDPLPEPTPLTLQEDGQVFGHIALWHDEHGGLTRHIGVGASVPHSRSDYAHFHIGTVATAEGTEVAAGPLTIRGGHAAAHLGLTDAQAHYDNVGSIWAQVVAFEDDWGIAVRGAAMPDLDEFTIRLIRATAPSGDWRDDNGNLELVACCQVPTPGFQVRRPRAMVASGGRVMSLVASCSLMPEPGAAHAINMLATRIERLERERKLANLRATL